MAILFSQADGSDQHYDTYEEFEQAMILMKRLNGEEVPQDLLDEAKAKHGVKETKPFQVQIDGNNFESAISEATRELAEALDEVAENRTPVSDECENPETEPKFEVGDRVKVVNNLSGGHPEGTVGVIEMVNCDDGTFDYEVDSEQGSPYSYTMYHGEVELELWGNEVEVGDKVRVVSSDDGSRIPYHRFSIGSIGEVTEVHGNGRLEVHDGTFPQMLLPHHFEKVEPLGKDANGEDLYKGDVVTGTEDNDYGYTNSTVDMEVMGKGSSILDEEANILVRILGESNTYGVDSSKFIKLSDDLSGDEQEFKVGDKVRVVGNDYGHCMDLGELREIKEVDPNEPKYNLSGSSCGYWAGTSDIERVHSSPKFQTGDVVKVTESFSDILGDRAICGAVYSYDENLGFGEPFVGTVFLEDNIDKIELVCRAQDRLDKY